MTSRHARLRCFPLCLGLLLGLISTLATPVRAEDEASDDTKACLSAYDQAQDLRADGKLRAAKEQAIACSRGQCPEALVKDCRQWLDQIDLSLPSVVFDVRDADGRFIAGAKIYVGDELLTDKLEGRAISLDPGAQLIRAEAEGYDSSELQVVIQEGQRNRSIAIVLKKPSAVVEGPVDPGEQDDGVPVATWVFGGLAVAGLVVGGVFLGLGLDKRSDLEACRPGCAGSDVDDMMTKLVVGDVAFAAAVVAGAASLTFYLTRPTPPTTTGTGSRAPSLAFAPTPHGVVGVLQGQF